MSDSLIWQEHATLEAPGPWEVISKSGCREITRSHDQNDVRTSTFRSRETLSSAKYPCATLSPTFMNNSVWFSCGHEVFLCSFFNNIILLPENTVLCMTFGPTNYRSSFGKLQTFLCCWSEVNANENVCESGFFLFWVAVTHPSILTKLLDSQYSRQMTLHLWYAWAAQAIVMTQHGHTHQWRRNACKNADNPSMMSRMATVKTEREKQ